MIQEKGGLTRFWLYRLVSIALVILVAWIAGNFVDTQMTEGAAYTWRRIIYLCTFYSILAVSLNLINGITGQFSIGHAAFYMIGAYSAAYCSKIVLAKAGLPPWLLLIVVTVIGALFAATAGWLVGLPSLRLRGDYLAVVTMGFGEIIRIFVINQDRLGGSFGFVGISKSTTLFYALVLLVISIAICRNLLKTPHGLAFLAIREDEMAADAMGVNTTRYKIWAFVIGASLAGAAGSMLAHFEGFISPDTFKMDVSFIVLTMVVIGGTGSITGSLIAATGIIMLQERLRTLGEIPAGPLYMVALLLFISALVTSAYCRKARPRPVITAVVWSGMMILSVVLGSLVGSQLSHIPALQESLTKTYKAADLRMVLFAIALIIIMLVRPQGVFGHHEFSWKLVGRMLRLRRREPILT